jgi:hypothetical protein
VSEYDNLYLKVLGPNRTACHGGVGQWAEPGVWMPKLTPRLCQSGYHVLSDTKQLLEWLGPEIWLCEVSGKIIHDTNKSVAAEARLVERLPWDDRSARLFAADCAEDVLPIFEREHPGDSRPRDAIEAARLFADGHISRSELDAAWAAARAAAAHVVRDLITPEQFGILAGTWNSAIGEVPA